MDIESSAGRLRDRNGKLASGGDAGTLNPDSRVDKLTQLRHNCTLAHVVGGCPDPVARLPESPCSLMPKAPYIALVIVLLFLVGGAVFLATWDIPPPSKSVEKVLPDERFPR